jgi:ketosteroid isomerase-like protein
MNCDITLPPEPPLREEHAMTRNISTILAAIDAFDADEFVGNLTDDVVFRFGNAEPSSGRAAVKQSIEGFWSTIDGMTHHVRNVWNIGDTTVTQVDVEYRRKDGKSVTVPNADILVWEGDLIRSWQIYIDLAPLFV